MYPRGSIKLSEVASIRFDEPMRSMEMEQTHQLDGTRTTAREATHVTRFGTASCER